MFLNRFCWLKAEGNVSDAEAKDILLNAITPATRAYLERKLEAIVDEDDDAMPPADYLERIPFSTYVRLLKRGPLLESYPAKPSKLDLRADPKRAQSSAASLDCQVASIFTPLQLPASHSTSSPTPSSLQGATPSSSNLP